MPGTILRTNYRATGGAVDITALGKGITLASINGGAGTPLPYGGVMWLTSLNGNTYSQSIYTTSAFGLMSAFYGSGMYDSGYKIQPIAIVPLSFSTCPAGDSAVIVATSIRTSGSLILFQAWASGVAVASASTCNFQFLGLVVSGP